MILGRGNKERNGRRKMEAWALVNTNTAVQKKSFGEALYKRWLMYIDVKPKSAETYKKAIKAFFYWLNEEGIDAPTREDILRYKEAMKATHKASTAQTYIVAVKLFFAWLEQEGLYKDVARNIKGVKIDKNHKKDYLTSSQAHEVISTMPRETEKDKRNYAIVSLMLTTGVRTIEVVRANIADFRTLGDSTVLFLQGKGRDDKTEYVKVAPEVEKAIRAYLATRKNAGTDAPLFTSTSHNNTGERMTTRSISGIAKDSMVKAGYDSEVLTAHSFRHTAGTLALMNGANLEQVQQMLRHTSINTTMIYMHGIERANNNSELKVANAIF